MGETVIPPEGSEDRHNQPLQFRTFFEEGRCPVESRLVHMEEVHVKYR
jgi:hypothetical protein